MVISHTDERWCDMSAAEVAITMDEQLLRRLDRVVRQASFPSRSRMIQEAVEEKLIRMDRSRLARECAKLDRNEERRMAEQGLATEISQWPQY
jgi:metal-responsive CopG/Arc/MetJ family transcriptional regulator